MKLTFRFEISNHKNILTILHIKHINKCSTLVLGFQLVIFRNSLLCVAAIVFAEHGSLSCVHVVNVPSYCIDLSIVGQISETASKKY